MTSNTAAPRVSVIITSYNREDYLAESIQSVLRQTFGDFELIVCDDGSVDRSAAIAERFAECDARIRVVRNLNNVGDYPNRNRAVEFVRGRYLKFHDSDDVMYAHCLQVMVSALEEHPTADFAMSGARAWPGGPCPMLLTPRLAYEREFLGTGLFQQGPASALFRTSFFRSVGGFPTEGAASDYLFWFDACARGSVLLVPGDLFHYRIHAGQELQNQKNLQQYARSRGRAWQVLHAPLCPLDGATLEQAKRNFLYTIVRDAYRHARHGRYRAAALGTARSPPDPLRMDALLAPATSAGRGGNAGCVDVIARVAAAAKSGCQSNPYS